VYVALALAVLLLVALVVVNRMREASDADREADNDESTARLGTLVDERDDDYEPYDASAFDSVLRPEARASEPAAPTYDDVTYDDAPSAYEEYREPAAEWTTTEYESAPASFDERAPADGDGAFDTTFEAVEYSTAFEGPATTDEPAIAFEEYTGPSRVTDRYDYEPPVGDEPYIDESIIDEVDASSVLADEGIIDESKVTTAETILAASQVSRFEPETITDEESNEETREILGRVAALLAKYE
jgi:hypothetical protein